MPTITGATLTDASAADLYDATPSLLGEADIQVMVTDAGFLVDLASYQGTPGGPSIGQIIEYLLSVLEAIGAIQDAMATEATLNAIAADVDAIVPDAAYAADALDLTTGSVQLKLDQLSVDIANIEPGGGLTTEEHDHLFTIEPVDYEQIAGDVWGYTLSQPDAMGYDAGPMAQTVLKWAADGELARIAYEGIPVPDRPHFRYHAIDPYAGIRWLGYWTNESATSAVPLLDLSLTQQGDTVWAYLNREYSGYTWTQQGPGDWPTGGSVWLVQAADQAYFRCTLTDQDIAGIWREQTIIQQNITVDVTTAPLWPGLSEADLLTPVALADQLAIDEDMEGVIVTVTVPPEKLGRYNIGGHTLDYGVGRMTFANDRGDLEPWQYLGFRTAIYTPRTMRRAAHAYFQVLGGAGGTVTPWRTLAMG